MYLGPKPPYSSPYPCPYPVLEGPLSRAPAPTCLVRVTGFKCGVKDLFL